ncbi:Retrovirus-related Pol polyprotein from transposon opus [Vitis vinifera]|uniref:Retrovirus-related Pol polyprotein from transposon opus n=1 Tax=Vitis vinifera TaxID=29760 RepID=A0A438BUT1_VITVI|nr:Retrovirus-related Pol polyprotein from transposon opus [Vitis vinifera]
MDGMQNDLSQKIDNLQYSISRLTNLNTVQEKGRFPSQLHQNPKGIHEVEAHEGESSQVRDVKALITLRSGKEVELPTPKPHVEKEEEKEETEKMRKSKEIRKVAVKGKRTMIQQKKGNQKCIKNLEVLRQVKVNIPLLDMIKQMPTYAKFLKNLCTIKRGLNVNKKAFLTEQSSSTKEIRDHSGANEKGEEVSTRLTSGWSVCIDYRKLNVVTRNDNFPLPFIDQVLERVSGHPFYCFLDGYSSKELSLGHIISKKGIEVDKAKVELIIKLPPPTTVKGVRHSLAMLGSTGGLLKDFSKLSKPLCELLGKDAKFLWDKRCQKSFEQLKQLLTTAPIVKAPNWQLPFEVMCDASDFAIRVVLGQREDGKPYVIYYASKTLNEAQKNYTTTEKELLAVVFALDKFRAYLVGSFIVVFSDHSALKYLLAKQDAKARLIRWILLLQEFNLQIKDKKGVEDVVVDHLSRLAIAHNSHVLPINDDFMEESLMLLEDVPWYAHIANYLITGEVPSEWKTQDRKHFFAKIHAYYWEKPFLSNIVQIKIIKKCVPEQEQQESSVIAMKVHVEATLPLRK